MKRQKRHSLPVFEETSLPKEIKRNPYQKNWREMATKKQKTSLRRSFKRNFNKKNLSRDNFLPKEFYETYLPTNLWRIIFNKQTIEERFLPKKSLRRHLHPKFSQGNPSRTFFQETLSTSLRKQFLKKHLYQKISEEEFLPKKDQN